MGLDMYLNREVYSQNGFSISLNGRRIAKSTIARYEVAYWRKANAIHAWLVKNVQNENDDCGTYFVPLEILKKLLSDIKTVLESKGTAKQNETVMAILPPQSGFFFGSTEIDDGYWDDLLATKDMLTKILKEEEYFKKKDIYSNLFYRSSW